jgi:hypothetical protein
MSDDAEPAEETSHMTTVRTQWQLRQQAARKPHFKIIDGEIVRYAVNPPADDLATTVADAVAAEKSEQEVAYAEIISNAEIGQMIEGHGVFFGTWEPKDTEGNSLGKIFNLFAAPEDLTDNSGNKNLYRYVDVLRRIAGLKNWHGHDGTHYATDKEIYKALKDGSYNGGWFIPTRDLLVGTDVDGHYFAQKDNLSAHKDKGALSGTFTMATASGSARPEWYWSSTECRNDPSSMQIVRCSDGGEVWSYKNVNLLSCRLVRLELRS